MNQFMPVFVVDSTSHLRKLAGLKGNYGLLAPFTCYDKLLEQIREIGQPLFIDSGVFEKENYPWYYQVKSCWENGYWQRKLCLADAENLKLKIKYYLDRCSQFSPDYVFAPDIIGEPLLSLYLARISWEEYCNCNYNYQLIGVIQVGHTLYHYSANKLPIKNDFLPYYQSPKSFLVPLISEYRNIGYKYLALGGLLKFEKTAPMGLKFGLSAEELDELLTWTRPNFVLGGLALTRLEVLKKHQISADSSNWLWWDAKYCNKRFAGRNVLKELVQL